VQDAVARDCRLSFEYTRADGDRGSRVVDPLGLVVKGMTWYLVARTPRGMRTYRISRMRAVTVLAVTFTRPARFNLARHWQRSVQEFAAQWQRCSLTLLLAPDAVELLTPWCVMRAVPALAPAGAPPGWNVVEVEFESERQAIFVALGLGSRGRVLAPEPLCSRIAAELAAMHTSLAG